MLNKLQHRIDDTLNGGSTFESKLLTISQILRAEVPHYGWVGFYLTQKDNPEMLEIGPYAGEHTDHTHIPYGKGVCGQVAESNEPKIVPDVRAESNYLSCSISVRSEIVYPIIKDGKHFGQIDIDSNEVDPFTDADLELLGYVCKQIENLI